MQHFGKNETLLNYEQVNKKPLGNRIKIGPIINGTESDQIFFGLAPGNISHSWKAMI